MAHKNRTKRKANPLLPNELKVTKNAAKALLARAIQEQLKKDRDRAPQASEIDPESISIKIDRKQPSTKKRPLAMKARWKAAGYETVYTHKQIKRLIRNVIKRALTENETAKVDKKKSGYGKISIIVCKREQKRYGSDKHNVTYFDGLKIRSTINPQALGPILAKFTYS